jgi:hypothetical protein
MPSGGCQRTGGRTDAPESFEQLSGEGFRAEASHRITVADGESSDAGVVTAKASQGFVQGLTLQYVSEIT